MNLLKFIRKIMRDLVELGELKSYYTVDESNTSLVFKYSLSDTRIKIRSRYVVKEKLNSMHGPITLECFRMHNEIWNIRETTTAIHLYQWTV